MSDIIMLSKVRLSFPNIAEPQKNVNEATGEVTYSYGCEFILEPDHPGMKQFQTQVSNLMTDKWAEHAPKVMAIVQQDRKKRCFGKGDEKVNQKTFEVYDGYAGNYYISCKKKSTPQIIQTDGTAIDPANTMAYQNLTRKMYGGCFVNAAIKPWLQDNKHGKAVRCELIALQFAGDGTPFGAGEADVSELFGNVSGATAAGADSSLPPFMQ